MDFENTLNILKDYYANTLIVQYNGKPKACATIKELTNLIYCNMLALQIEYAFDWKTAVGSQLDIIGEWVGISRTYNIPSMAGKVYFSYPETDKLYPVDITTSNQHGYTDYTNFNTDEGRFLRYNDLKGIDSELNDNDYRILIGLKIIYNNISHTSGAIDNAIWNYFGGNTYYSDTSIAIGTVIYLDKELTQVYGTVTQTNSDIVTIENNGLQIYSGYFWESINGNIYKIGIGPVYTSWQPQKIIYNFPSSLEEIFEIALYKNILPAPIGTEILLNEI